MKNKHRRALSGLLALVLCVSSLGTSAFAAEAGSQLIGEKATAKYEGDHDALAEDAYPGGGDHTPFIKISHPEKPASKMEYDPTDKKANDGKNRELHQDEVFADGLIDYIGNEVIGVPGVDEGANGQGDRGQTYSWASFAYGDWMYVSTLFNSTEQTGRLLGKPTNPEELDKSYGGDMFVKEPDDLSTGSTPDMVTGSTLCKINVKTGEVKILMSKSKNGIEPSFRNAVEYHGKLYFCGSVNHLPSIFEVDPETDAFQCVYQDPSIRDHVGGPSAAWAESMAKGICPAIRSLGVFRDYLVISTVGTDGNPYIAVSQDPAKGFTKIASTWKDVENRIPGELLGYPACKTPDSIMGGSIWEMVEFNDKLYVAICTGTPDNAPEWHYKTGDDGEFVLDDNGQKIKVLDTMQSFAIIVGEFDDAEGTKTPADASAWTWRPLVGDEDDGARYPFGIDPERTRSSACNMVVYDDHLYIGEYTDSQIAFRNMTESEFDYLTKNLNESVSLYRMDKDENIEKVMGDPTTMFPDSLSGIDESGFGRRENMYIWQMKVYNDKLYAGTFDKTMMLNPLARAAYDSMQKQQKSLNEELSALNALVEESAPAEEPVPENEELLPEDETLPEDEILPEDPEAELNSQEQAEEPLSPEQELFRSLLEAKEFYDMRMNEVDLFSDIVQVPVENSHILLPSSIFEKDVLVTVDSSETLYMALMMANDLASQDPEQMNTTERLSTFIQYSKLRDEINAYCADSVPQVMSAAADTLAEEEKDEITNLVDVLKYLQDSIAGFDMYVSEDGEHFKQITRSGMGDPYNQGLRVFAVNNDPNNSWMTIGTANPFYGTQIWRMEDEALTTEIVEPDQITVKVNFVTNVGVPVKNDWDKPDEIYVHKGVDKVNPSDLDIMMPTDHELQSTKAVRIEEKDGVHSITIKVLPRTKDVRVSFVDVNKAESDQLVGTALVRVGESKNHLRDSDFKEFIPEGYVKNDSKDKIEIKTAGESSGYIATVPVQRAYSLSVTNGTAKVERERVSAVPAGTEVTITADVKDGMRFVQWVCENENVQIKDPASAETTFVMPAEDVKLSAVVAASDTLDVKVNGGKADVWTAEPGTEITITAAETAGQKFLNWSCSDESVQFADPNAATTTFVMPDHSVEVTANFEKLAATEIRVSTAPHKTIYNAGESFRTDGMVVEAVYEDESVGVITDYEIENGTNLVEDQESITIKYTQGDTVLTTTQSIIVKAAPKAAAVTGTVTSFGEETEVTIELFAAAAEEPSYSTTVTGNTAQYAIQDVKAGTYTMKVTKANHVARTYEVVVTDGGAAQDVQINLLGDVNLDGKVDTRDWTRIYKHTNGTEPLEDYALACADVNLDGKVDTRDWTRIYKHCNSIDPLW